MRLHHLAIQAHDVERMTAFYRDVLGLPAARRQPHAVWLQMGDAILMIETARALPTATSTWPSELPGLHLVALAIAPHEREAWRAKLTAAGHPVVHETGFTIYVRDPEGNRVGLSHFPEPRSATP